MRKKKWRGIPVEICDGEGDGVEWDGAQGVMMWVWFEEMSSY